ncbi:MAG: phosphonate C-P lyase system protein PhnH [Reyranella sp.]|uniref:phosphonate C-P lyase system protein PhnH n=1 Tax=Reyranella sp. TaxID=1929291 RepID=UPI001AD19F34|nr:phosphonate C-P lyase system protein PhnH [Reyranella sp.]MBN9091140.1 phosphonate C-P lyase system protein PhnH [Reyranella sp.]
MTDLARGLADPAHDAQRLFRAVLDGFSHPGRIVALPQAPAGVGPLSAAATAFVLTLVDRDTPLWLAPAFDRDAVRDFVRFHTGAPIVAREAEALFALLTPDRAATLDGFAIGSDPYPDRSATLIVEVPSLSTGPERFLRGPGIQSRTTARVDGLPDSFWSEWKANNALFPCGVDVVLTACSELLALPRGIVVEA